MRNTWLDEKIVYEVAERISFTLSKTFIGTESNLDDWSKFSLDMMRNLPARIRDSLMWKYIFKFEFDSHEQVQTLEFVRLPWLV